MVSMVIHMHLIHMHVMFVRLGSTSCELTSEWKMEGSPAVKQEALCSLLNVMSVYVFWRKGGKAAVGDPGSSEL